MWECYQLSVLSLFLLFIWLECKDPVAPWEVIIWYTLVKKNRSDILHQCMSDDILKMFKELLWERLNK